MFPLIVAGAVVGAAGLALGRFIGPRVRGWFGDVQGYPYPALPVMNYAALPSYRLSPAPEVISPIPDAWRRWNGARPEVAGSPENSVLAMPGLENWTPADRAALFDVAHQTGIPVDSLVLTMYSESRLIPSALNSVPAAGLNQITTQARIPGFTTPDQIRAVARMSAADQLHYVVLPFMQSLGQKVVGADPGRLYMNNFLPAVARASEDKVIARAGDQTPLVPADQRLTLDAIYRNNPFDTTRKGYYTVGDVFDHIASLARKANGRRMTVDGSVLEPGVQSFDADHMASGPQSQKHKPPPRKDHPHPPGGISAAAKAKAAETKKLASITKERNDDRATIAKLQSQQAQQAAQMLAQQQQQQQAQQGQDQGQGSGSGGGSPSGGGGDSGGGSGDSGGGGSPSGGGGGSPDGGTPQGPPPSQAMVPAQSQAMVPAQAMPDMSAGMSLFGDMNTFAPAQTPDDFSPDKASGKGGGGGGGGGHGGGGGGGHGGGGGGGWGGGWGGGGHGGGWGGRGGRGWGRGGWGGGGWGGWYGDWPWFNGIYVGPDFVQWVAVTPDGVVYEAGPYPYRIPPRFLAGRVYSAEGQELGQVDWDGDGNVFMPNWSPEKFAAGCESCMRKASGAAGGPGPMPASERSLFEAQRRAQGTWGSAGGAPLSSGVGGGIPGMPSVQTGPRGPFGVGGFLAPWLEGPMYDFDVDMPIPNFQDLPQYQDPPPEPQPVYMVASPEGTAGGGIPAGLIPIDGVGWVTPKEAMRHGAKLMADGSWDLSNVHESEQEPEKKAKGGGRSCDNPFAGARAVSEEPDVPKSEKASGASGAPRGVPRGVPHMDPVAIITRGIAPAVQEGSQDPIQWCQITVNEYDLMTTCEPIAVGGLRLPTSMEDEYVIGNLIGALPLTKAVSDARWAQGERVVSLGLADKSGALGNDPGQVQRYNAVIGPNTGRLRDGYQKEGVLVAGLAPAGRGALAQYGLRKNTAGAVFQDGNPGSHDGRYKDYSNTPNYMSWNALKNGQPVDLRDELAVGCSLGGPLPAWMIQKFRSSENVA